MSRTYPRIAALKTAAQFQAHVAALGATLPFDADLQSAPESPLAGLSFVPDPADVEAAEERDVAEKPQAEAPAAVRPLGRRVPLTLAIAGVVLIPLGLATLWWSTLEIYTTTTVYERLEYEQYVRLLLQFSATPLLTVGLASLAAAVVVQAVRRSRA